MSTRPKFLKVLSLVDLPTQQAVEGELVINLKTPKMLGITIPLSLSAPTN
jgi:hypothetical protein